MNNNNYPPNQQGGQYPSSSNNMQYNYTMNQPYAANMGNMYPDQYYPQQDGYQGYPQENFEEDDYDNLDEIDRVGPLINYNLKYNTNYIPNLLQELTKGSSADFEQEMLQAMDSPSYGHQQRHYNEPYGGHGGHNQSRAGPHVPQAAVPTQNGKLSQFAGEFWFPECRNCPCCKGFKHGCDCCKTGGVDTCKDASCIDGAMVSQVSADLAARGGAPEPARAPAPQAPTGAPKQGGYNVAAPSAGGDNFCKFEKSPGGCRFGASCRFQHASAGGSVFNAYPPAGAGNAGSGPSKCVFFARGNCQFGDSCRFAHF